VLRTYRRAARERRKAESERQQGFTAANMAQCAKMPQDRLETGKADALHTPRETLQSLPLFAAQETVPETAPDHEVVTKLREIRPDDLTARQALDLLYELTAKAK